MMVIWLECYEDHLNLPICTKTNFHQIPYLHKSLFTADLLYCMNTGLETSPPRSSDVLVIGLHLMSSGLLRVHLQGPTGRVGLASPIIDGMVISRRALGPLVRHTALNMARRRRLDSDRYFSFQVSFKLVTDWFVISYQPPHVRRRLKVQDIAQKYRREMSTPELLTYLFSKP